MLEKRKAWIDKKNNKLILHQIHTSPSWAWVSVWNPLKDEISVLESVQRRTKTVTKTVSTPRSISPSLVAEEPGDTWSKCTNFSPTVTQLNGTKTRAKTVKFNTIFWQIEKSNPEIRFRTKFSYLLIPSNINLKNVSAIYFPYINN